MSDKASKNTSRHPFWVLLTSILVIVFLRGAWRFILTLPFLRPTSLYDHSDVSFDVSRSADQIVFVGAGRGQQDLYLLSMKSKRVTRLTNTPGLERDAAFSHDGKYIAYACTTSVGDSSHIFVRSVDGALVRQLTKGVNFSDRWPSFSHDGKRVVFARADRHRAYSMGGITWDNWDICVMNVDGTALQHITQGNYYESYPPMFSPDDRTILFAAAPHSTSNTLPNVFLVAANQRQVPRQITTSGRNSWPSYSPDGRHIIFISDRVTAFEYDIFEADSTGENPRPLKVTRLTHYNQRPIFTPDGESIFYLGDPEAKSIIRYGLYRVGTDGKEPHRFADEQLFDAPLQWKPK